MYVIDIVLSVCFLLRVTGIVSVNSHWIKAV
jgi:hypothetical protein